MSSRIEGLLYDTRKLVYPVGKLELYSIERTYLKAIRNGDYNLADRCLTAVNQIAFDSHISASPINSSDVPESQKTACKIIGAIIAKETMRRLSELF